ncbi:MAG: DegT/DnrJ/EryC1/StrS family aminotransferase [Steroidobacteraceae bacterium]
MTYYAPAGTPVTLGDIARATLGASAAASATLAATLRCVSGLEHAWPTSSGRAAMTIILQAMHEARGDSSRNEVIVPAYTCYSVPAAIECAGLKPRLCDIDPVTLGMDPEALDRCDFSRTLAVISANLYGLPNALGEIEAVCRRRNVFLLDDAAQALGAKLDGRAAGSFGDVGLYSFDKGKIISTIQGGAVVCRQSDLTAHLEAALAKLPQCSFRESSGNLLKLVIYSIFLRPVLYGVIRQLPFTGLGHTHYETRFPVTAPTQWQAGVATRLLERLSELNDRRRALAAAYQAALEGVPGLELVQPLPGAEPAFARYPFRVREPETRDRVVAALDRAGIGATTSYPLSLADVPEVIAKVPPSDRSCQWARRVARTIVTLPTHAFCPLNIAERARKTLIECLG